MFFISLWKFRIRLG